MDTADAYRRTMDVSPPPWLTSVAGLQNIEETSPLNREDITEILAREEQLFGPVSSDDFFEKRTAFLESAEAFAQEAFTKLADQLCPSVAHFLSRDGSFRQDELEATFRARLMAIDGVVIGDPLLTPPMSGSYYANYGLILLNGAAFEKVELGEKSLEDYLINAILAHELLHAMMTGARTFGAMEFDGEHIDLITRNGLVTSHSPDDKPVSRPNELVQHLSWVNEAFIEDVRQQVFQTQAGAYPMKLAVLRTLQVFDTSLALTLKQVAATSAPPSKVTQRIENLLGPLGSEFVEDITSQEEPWKYPSVVKDMIQTIANLFPKPVRAQVTDELTRQWDVTKQHLLV